MLHTKQERAGAHRTTPAPALQSSTLLLLIFIADVLAHGALLHLPYYWDEAGYYIPAAFDFFRTGTLIPFSTLSNAHPPGLSLYLAVWWKLFGFSPLTTRIALCFTASLALLAVYRLALDGLRSNRAAFAVTTLTALYPVWFTQSTLAHADMPACAATLWGLYFALGPGRRRIWLAAGCFAVAALTKEIAIGTPLALAGWELWLITRRRGSGQQALEHIQSTHREPSKCERGISVEESHWSEKPDRYAKIENVFALLTPLLPLALWFAYHRWRTGFIFGNPEYLRYNATATLSVERVLLALGHRVMHLTAHLNLFVPIAIALGSLLLSKLPLRAGLVKRLRIELWIVLAANALLFSLLGGALLTRYLLPMYALVLLLAMSAVTTRIERWGWFVAVSAVAFVAGLVLPPPYRVAPEDTLAYRDAVVLEQQAITFIQADYPHSTVLSAWPVTDGLRKPELGYVSKPMPVVAIDNFSLGSLQKLTNPPAGSTAQSYSTAVVFSTKYDPQGLQLRLGRWNEQQEERYFDLHHDLSAGAVAQLLGGTVVWQQHRGGQWAAVLRFEHPQLAMLATAAGCASYN